MHSHVQWFTYIMSYYTHNVNKKQILFNLFNCKIFLISIETRLISNLGIPSLKVRTTICSNKILLLPEWIELSSDCLAKHIIPKIHIVNNVKTAPAANRNGLNRYYISMSLYNNSEQVYCIIWAQITQHERMFDTMASIEKRGNTYTIVVSAGYDVNGKKLREKTTFVPDPDMTEKQQQKALEKFTYDFEEKVKNGKYLNGEKITLKEFTDRWLKDYAPQQLERTTLSGYILQINQKIIPALGHLKLAKIKPIHLQSFYNNLLEDGVRKDGKAGGYSPSSIKKCHAILSSILSTAVQWQIIESNPCDRVSPPKQTKIVNDIKHFTLEQAEVFLNALDMDYKTVYKAHDRIDDTGKKYHVEDYKETRSISLQFKVFFNLALFGGLRRGELIALTWDDINLENNSVNITKSTGYVGNIMVTKAPKNKSSIRVVNIPTLVTNLLKKLKYEQKEYKLSIGDQWQGDNYIFTQWNGKQMNLSTPYHTFKDIINKYNATVKEGPLKLPDIPLHGLRHTSATLLISENVDIRTVSARLGHAQTSTTMNIYAHSLKKMDEKAAETLDNLFKKQA